MLTLLQGIIAPDDDTSVWRHRKLSERLAADAEFNHAFTRAAELFLGERYNVTPMVASRKYHTFCSELIGRLFSRFGYPFARDPVNLLPSDVAEAVMCAGGEWMNVTDKVRATLATDALYAKLYGDDAELARALANGLYDASRVASICGAHWTEGTNNLNRFGDFEIKRWGDYQQTGLDPHKVPTMSELGHEWFWYFIQDATGVPMEKIKADPWPFFIHATCSG